METKNLHNKNISLSEDKIVALIQCLDLAAKNAKDTINTSVFLHEIKVDLGIDDKSLKSFQLEHTLQQASEVLEKRKAEAQEDK